MDVEYVVQDIFALTRPQWKLAENLEDAGHAFAAAVNQNYQPQDVGKVADAEEADDDASSGEGAEEDELRIQEMDEAQSSSEEAEADSEVMLKDLPFWYES